MFLCSTLKRFSAALCVASTVIGLSACSSAPAPKPGEAPRWPTLPLAPVPAYMKGTIYERVRLANTEPFPVGGYSLVVNLHNTGDGTASSAIREYITKQMVIHGVGSLMNGKMADLTPEQILRDKRVSVVRVVGMLPVGARAGQQFDVNVSAMDGNSTTSLAHGRMWQADLSERGLINPTAIGARVLAQVNGGEIFVNPAYALTDSGPNQAALKSSLRNGIIMNGGIVTMDRPIFLQLREPQSSTARLIEETIRHHWQDDSVAAAQDEGVVDYVPAFYNGDWQHFVGVLTHLYVNNSQAFLVNKAKELVVAAHQKDAKLADISFCWEGIGPDALPFYSSLISDPNPDIAFAAARAAAYNSDVAAKHALLEMTQDSNNPNQLAAVQTLAGLPNSPEVNHMLRTLLDSDNSTVRVAAYRILSHDGEGIFSKKIGDSFYLDIVESGGKPMVWASSSGVPRIAIFGFHLGINVPVTFTAMDSRLMIASNSDNQLLNIFYRDPALVKPLNVVVDNDLPGIIWRLGGEGPAGEPLFDFSYDDVVAILENLDKQKLLVARESKTELAAVSVVLEHPIVDANPLSTVPRESVGGRPTGHQAEAFAPGERPAATQPSTGVPHAQRD